MTFHDPLADPMPHAPSLKMFNIYGVGIATERYVAVLVTPTLTLTLTIDLAFLPRPDHLGPTGHQSPADHCNLAQSGFIT